MQRRLVLSLLLPALLYFATSGISTHHAAAMGFDYRSIRRPPPAINAAPPADDRIFITQGHHIGVILPLQSSAFGRLAEQVRLGILTASNMASDTSLPIIIYATTADSLRIGEAYERAVSSGAQAVIGPLTRKGVSELARSGRITRMSRPSATPACVLRV